jgi:hypothetical protein
MVKDWANVAEEKKAKKNRAVIYLMNFKMIIYSIV